MQELFLRQLGLAESGISIAMQAKASGQVPWNLYHHDVTVCVILAKLLLAATPGAAGRFDPLSTTTE